MKTPQSLAPLADARFRLFFAGRAVSQFGGSMTPVALAFGVLEISDSPGDLGRVLAAEGIALCGFRLFGGVVADRFSRSTVLVVSHLGSATTQAAVAALLISGRAELWMLIVLTALFGTVLAFTFPALQGVVPQVVPRGQLQRANAMLAFTLNTARVVGPSIAGVLVVTVGPGWAIAADALSFAVAAVLLGRLRLQAAERTVHTTMVHDLRVGWSEFISRTWVWVIVAAFGVLNAIHAGIWFTLGPPIAKLSIGEAQWGVVLSAEAVGFVVMSVILLRVTLRFPLRAGMIGITALAIPMLMLGLRPEVIPLVATAFVAGAGTEVFSIGWQTAMQQHIPGDVLSRVMSYDALGSFVAIPIGQLLAGPLAEWFGARDVIVVGALLFAGISVSTLASSSVRNLRHAPADEPVAA